RSSDLNSTCCEFDDLCKFFRSRVEVHGRVGEEIGAAFIGDDVHTSNSAYTFRDSDYLECRRYSLRIVFRETGDKRVCISNFHHHRPVVVAFTHQAQAILVCDTLALTFLVKDLRIPFDVFIFVSRIDDRAIFKVKTVLLDHLKNLSFVTEKDWLGDLLIFKHLRGLEYLWMRCFSKYNSFGIPFSAVDDSRHQFVIDTDALQ